MCLGILFAMLTTATPAAHAELSGWIWTGGLYGYSVQDGNWVYLNPSGVVWLYIFNTGQWKESVDGWQYIQWPYLYSIDYNSWVYVLIPGGLWVYHYATGQWTVMY
jgi:hypothetical protein